MTFSIEAGKSARNSPNHDSNRQLTLKFLVNSIFRNCSAALSKNPPRHPLPLRWLTGLPGAPRGAKWKRWI